MPEMKHIEQQNWFYQHPCLSNLTILLITTVLTFCVAEVALRLNGKIPGYVPRYSNRAFKPVNQLKVRESFITDGEGVFKANPDYKWPAEYQINSDGFRSVEFRQYETTRTKILFLGDSFTWGGSAEPITNCFVDIVTRRGYLTFNTGIAGTCPNQYAYLAEKHVPLLRPDIVAVMFYMGNDLILPFPMLPHKNLFHVTNAGWLYAFDENGNYMSPQEAYDYYLTKYNLVRPKDTRKTPKTKIRQIFMKSVIGTYFWLRLSEVKWQLINFFDQSFVNSSSNNNNSDFPRKENLNYPEKDKGDVQKWTRRSLAKIKAVSENHGARFKLFLIPAHPGLRNENNSIEHNLQIFEGFNPFIPDFLTRDDYMDLPNDHFNNSGHRKYAEFILRTVAP
jgi:hypothetical protein